MSQNESLNEGRIQPDDGYREYVCEWSIEVYAQSPREAAELAEQIARDGASGADLARTWQVFSPGTDGVLIDLADDENAPPRPDRFGRDWGSLPDDELCAECGQPDNCGDCTHEPLSDAEYADLHK